MSPILGSQGSKSGAGSTRTEPVVADNGCEDESEGCDIGDLLDGDSETEDSEELLGEDDPDFLYEEVEAAAEGLNLEFWILKDYLSDTVVARSDTATKGKGKGRGKTAAATATRKLDETDWKM